MARYGMIPHTMDSVAQRTEYGLSPKDRWFCASKRGKHDQDQIDPLESRIRRVRRSSPTTFSPNLLPKETLEPDSTDIDVGDCSGIVLYIMQTASSLETNQDDTTERRGVGQFIDRSKWLSLLILVSILSLNQMTTDVTSHTFFGSSPELSSRILQAPAPKLSPQLLDDFKFCNATWLNDPEERARRVDIWYQCQGPRYDKFSYNLQQHVEEMYESREKPGTWGHRKYSIPARKSILVLGNSHLRQVGYSMACQMKDQITSIQRFQDDLLPNSGTCIHFQNGAELCLVINSYVPYSPRWKDLLELKLNRTLESFHAIVMGRFNIVKNPSVLKHVFYQTILEVQRKLPRDYLVDYSTRKTPSVVDVSKHVKNIPLVATSTFSNEYKNQFEKDCKRMKAMKENRPFLCLDLSKYVRHIGHGSSENRYNISDASRASPRAHRCVGPRGGHPDLVAWDLAEFLYEHVDG